MLEKESNVERFVDSESISTYDILQDPWRDGKTRQAALWTALEKIAVTQIWDQSSRSLIDLKGQEQ